MHFSRVLSAFAPPRGVLRSFHFMHISIIFCFYFLFLRFYFFQYTCVCNHVSHWLSGAFCPRVPPLAPMRGGSAPLRPLESFLSFSVSQCYYTL